MKTEQKPKINPYSFTNPIILAMVMDAYQEGYAAGLHDKAKELSASIEQLNFATKRED